MKKLNLLSILSCATCLFLVVNTPAFAGKPVKPPGPTIPPIVSIASPQDHAVVIENALDVIVNFSSPEGLSIDSVKLRVDNVDTLSSTVRGGTSYTFRLDVTNLSIGEHTLQAFAYIAGLEGKSPVAIITKSATPTPSRIIDNITFNPAGAIVNEQSEITITARINSDSDLIESEITLQRLDKYLQPIGFLGYLHDDGLQGDTKANDGIYTVKITLFETSPSEINLRIFAKYMTAPTPISSCVIKLNAIIPISENELSTIISVEENATQLFESLKAQYGEVAARQMIVDWIKQQPSVKNAGIASDNYSIWILFSSGLEGGISTAPAGTLGQGDNPGSKKNPPTPSLVTPDKASAIVLAPIVNEYGNELPEYIAQKLTQKYIPTAVISSSDVTIDLLKKLSDYSVIFIFTHGNIGKNNDLLIMTGEIADPTNYRQYAFDIATGRIKIENGKYAITSSFIEYYNGTFPKSLVYFNACNSLKDTVMAEQFLNKGAATYFGYDGTMTVETATNIVKILFDSLLDNHMTTKESYGQVANIIDPLFQSRLKMMGEENLVLAERPIITNESPKGVSASTRPTIKARIYSPNQTDIPIDLSSIVMTLDGSKVSHTVTLQSGGTDIIVSYIPPNNLPVSDYIEHTVTINAKNYIGLAAETKTWKFTIPPGWKETWEMALDGVYHFEDILGLDGTIWDTVTGQPSNITIANQTMTLNSFNGYSYGQPSSGLARIAYYEPSQPDPWPMNIIIPKDAKLYLYLSNIDITNTTYFNDAANMFASDDGFIITIEVRTYFAASFKGQNFLVQLDFNYDPIYHYPNNYSWMVPLGDLSTGIQVIDLYNLLATNSIAVNDVLNGSSYPDSKFTDFYDGTISTRGCFIKLLMFDVRTSPLSGMQQPYLNTVTIDDIVIR